ncbi:hypothetical protein OPQ81_008361 [Rhizoctonia solani]|nr:hypothetical protein OPQ81_008361 [Rhizoctonia solani]
MATKSSESNNRTHPLEECYSPDFATCDHIIHILRRIQLSPQPQAEAAKYISKFKQDQVNHLAVMISDLSCKSLSIGEDIHALILRADSIVVPIIPEAITRAQAISHFPFGIKCIEGFNNIATRIFTNNTSEGEARADLRCLIQGLSELQAGRQRLQQVVSSISRQSPHKRSEGHARPNMRNSHGWTSIEGTQERDVASHIGHENPWYPILETSSAVGKSIIHYTSTLTRTFDQMKDMMHRECSNCMQSTVWEQHANKERGLKSIEAGRMKHSADLYNAILKPILEEFAARVTIDPRRSTSDVPESQRGPSPVI